ncbi:MAG: 3-oxoacyl-[acyl-carrier-protein] synthase III C-terminal domain-containing protein [Acidimicrobiales bacterium]
MHDLPQPYITAHGAFLPGPGVSNDEMEQRLGLVGGEPSKYRSRILEANGITNRHYAVDEHGNQTHLNQDLAALAVQDAIGRRGVDLGEVGMLSVGTTMPDLLMPGFASMVHGRLAEDDPTAAPMEVLSASGICASGAAAMRHANNAIRLGDHRRAVAVASELPSSMMKASRFEQESTLAPSRTETATAYQYFNADFLRWMLSDGAGAVLIEAEPHPTELSLRVDWIELTSYANDYPTCMFLGTSDPRNPAIGNTWLSVDNATAADAQGMMVVRQDTQLLAESLLPVGTEEAKRLIKAGRIDPDLGYDWFLPHMSSYFFKDFLAAGLADVGLDIPDERWFTNLTTRGNTGSASIYLMLEEAMRTGMFAEGDRILALVPESGRFVMSFMQFTCVSPDSAR